MIWKNPGLAFACAALLAACSGGGGGGGEAPSFTDGLGLSGQAPGTFLVTATNVPLGPSFIPAVTLDEQGRGLVVWFDSVPFRQLMWQRGDANQQWSALSEIGPGVRAFTLRGNSAGDAVLGFSSVVDPPRILRHTPATGWAAAPLDVPFSSAPPLATFPLRSTAFPPMDKGSDLALMTDGSIVLSRAAPASVPSGLKTASFRVFRHRAVSGWETVHETPPLFSPSDDQRFYLATNLDGTAMFFWVHAEPPQATSGPIHTLNFQSLNVLTGTALGALAFAEGEYDPCTITAANSPSRFKVLAVVHRLGPIAPCTNLDLIRISTDFSGTSVNRDRMNAGATLFDKPMVAMNQQGDAIAIWIQATTGAPARLVWSQSLVGGPWSPPQPVLPESAGMGEIAASTVATSLHNMVSFSVNTAFAANANGQVVSVLPTNKNGREYLVTGRFSFATGWNWQLAANMMGTANGGVSAGVGIDSAGTGLLIYYATPCERTQAPPGFAPSSCGPQGTFALKF